MAGLELYLIRHGIAAERGPDYPDDSARPLTPEGIKALKRTATSLNQLGVQFDLIVCSPLVRTRQTAEVLAEGLDERPPIDSSDALTPEGTPARAVREIGRHRKLRRLALVGHEPNIGELAAHLLGAAGAVPFKKGAIARIDIDALPPDGAGALRWFLPPKVLRLGG